MCRGVWRELAMGWVCEGKWRRRQILCVLLLPTRLM